MPLHAEVLLFVGGGIEGAGERGVVVGNDNSGPALSAQRPLVHNSVNRPRVNPIELWIWLE